MKLTRYYAINEQGTEVGIAHEVVTSDHELEDKILFFEEYLAIPNLDPYPVNSLAFFTEEGLKAHSQLINLWIQRAEKEGYVIGRKEVTLGDHVIYYQDVDQLILDQTAIIGWSRGGYC